MCVCVCVCVCVRVCVCVLVCYLPSNQSAYYKGVGHHKVIDLWGVCSCTPIIVIVSCTSIGMLKARVYSKLICFATCTVHAGGYTGMCSREL